MPLTISGIAWANTGKVAARVRYTVQMTNRELVAVNWRDGF